MLKFYKTAEGVMHELPQPIEGCWISLTEPTSEELNLLQEKTGVDHDFIRAALDEEEASRIESDDGQTLIVIDFPVEEKDTPHETAAAKREMREMKQHLRNRSGSKTTKKQVAQGKHRASAGAANYYTMPMSMIITHDYVITVSLTSNPITDDFARGAIKNVNTAFKTQFVFYLLLRVASYYLRYLKQIDRLSNTVERKLHTSMRNEELIQLLSLEKSLVYFSTSLKSTEKVLDKLLRKRQVRFYDEDQDLLEDVTVEFRQAVEMSEIYSSILSGTMDAFASIISNNLNIVMKVLSVITIVMAVPTMVFSFYGMNTDDLLPLAGQPWLILVISLAASIAAAIYLTKRKYTS
ncbi:MAG: magnesium transporter CorA family protein [Oscillospiraceae bacterium]|jgi:magnesium transporter|nr:magnesium transporter CorA family protein [Oscillospiraceae bacterium]